MEVDWQEITPRIGSVIFNMKVKNVIIGSIHYNLVDRSSWTGSMRLPGINSIQINHESVPVIKTKMEKLYEEWIEMMGLQRVDLQREN